MRSPAGTKTFLITVVVAALALIASASHAGAATSPTITATPLAPSIGDRVTVRGKHFKARKKCTFTVDDVQFGAGRSSKRGTVRLSFTIPTGASADLSITLKCGTIAVSTTIAVSDGDGTSNGANGKGDDPGGDVGDDSGDDSGDDPAFNVNF